jgi:hypothetical protein
MVRETLIFHQRSAAYVEIDVDADAGERVANV